MRPVLATPHRPRTLSFRLRILGGVLGLTLLVVSSAFAQGAELESAVAAYQAANFDQAIEMFSTVAQDPNANKAARKEALQYLGRAYIAKRMTDEARGVVQELIELEPPIVELNPDVEPPPLMNIYYEVRKEYTDDYSVERASPGMQTLAIIDFTNSSIGDDLEKYAPLERGFPSMMINYLNGATNLKVIERERIQWLLDELKLQKDPGLVDQATAVRAGKLLGANAVLIGSYTVAGRRMWMSARLVNVETGEIMLAEQITGNPNNFFELVEDLSTQVTKAINVTLANTDVGPRTETKSLDAMLSYSEGLALLEKQDYRAAYEKFREALEYDPNYTRAKLKAESLTPVLASL